MQCALSSCSEAAKRKCAACKSLGYCSREHQRDDWKSHKKECKRITKARKAATASEGGAAGGGRDAAALEGKDAGGDGGGAAEQSTPPLHITLRALMEDDAFDINTTRCGPHGFWALEFVLGAEDEPIDEDAVKLVLDAPGLNIHVTNDVNKNMI
jgi:hypothetical protein